MGRGWRRAGRTAIAGRVLDVVGATVLEVGARVGELDCLVQGALAGSRGHVGNEHVGKRVQARGIGGSASDIDRGAVHIELWGTRHLGHPGPRKSSLAIGYGVRERIFEGFDSIDAGAATLDALDDLENGILGRGGVGGVGELARTTSVDGTAIELELLSLTDLHVVHLGDSKAILALAGELFGSDGGLVDLDLVGRVGNRVGDGDVGVGSRNEGRSRNES